MTSSIRNIAFLALTAGLGIGAYLLVNSSLLRGSEVDAAGVPVTIELTAGPGPDRSGSREASGPGDGSDLVAIDLEPRVRGGEISGGDNVGTTVIWPLEVEMSLAIDGRVEVPEGAQPIKWGASAGLKGSVRGASGQPIGATVEFIYGPNEGRQLKTDGRGRFGASNLLPGISVMRLTTADGQTVEREVSLTARTHRDFHISFAGTSYVAGTVKDERGAVVEGAEVRIDGRLEFTNADGVFSFSRVPAGSALVSVYKEGFARCSQKVGVGFRKSIIPKDFPIFLQKGGQLRISTSRSVGAAEPSLAYVMPAAGPGRTGDGRSFPWHEINPVEIPPGGSALVEGLPLDSVNVRFFHRGAVPKPESKNVRIHGQRENTVTIDLMPAPLVRGLVTDGGKPAVGATVEIEASDRSHATSQAMGQKGPYFAMNMVVTTVPAAFSETQTDGKGVFTFTSQPGLVTTYYATVTSKDGLRRGVGVIKPGDTNVSIRLEPIEDRVGSIEVALPGRFQGLPVEVSVNGNPGEPFMLRPGMPLLIEELPFGHWDLQVRWRGASVVARQVVEVTEGGAKIQGSLPPGAIQGQTQEERERALAAEEITAEAARPR